MNLSADDLRELNAAYARYENNTGRQWVFSIDGILRDRRIRGATFDGQRIIVQARTLSEARQLATQGLRDTVAMLQDTKSVLAAGMTLEVPEERPLKPGEAEARERNRRMVIDALEGKE
jgi:hypothetical protein